MVSFLITRPSLRHSVNKMLLELLNEAIANTLFLIMAGFLLVIGSKAGTIP